MTAGTIIALVVVGIVVVVVIGVIGIYNSLIRSRNEVDNAWAQIDVQLKRRHDLIPNLVETAKGYMSHERETLEAVIQARNQAAGAQGAGQASGAESALSGALTQFNLVVERYPDLKANQNFLSLQEELSSTENKIGFARQYYNDTTTRYNTRIQVFPNSIIAGSFNFGKKDLFELEDEAERAVPKVEF